MTIVVTGMSCKYRQVGARTNCTMTPMSVHFIIAKREDKLARGAFLPKPCPTGVSLRPLLAFHSGFNFRVPTSLVKPGHLERQLAHIFCCGMKYRRIPRCYLIASN